MKKHLLTSFTFLLSLSLSAQITLTQADYGQAGDSIVIGYDNAPPANMSVGSTGNQTWDFTSLSLNNINTLNFKNPANTTSGSQFPNADLAIERQQDTLFFISNATEFEVDGVSGDGFNVGVSLVIDFDPNSKQMEFASTYNDSYVDTAMFDTTVSCQAINISLCDSARVRRRLIATSELDAYGTIQTPGGTFTVLRQYFREDNLDSVWLKYPGPFPPAGWGFFQDSTSVVHNYRWIANGEKWPVLTAVADAQNGNIVSAEYLVGDQVLGFVDSENDPSCNGTCDGTASVYAVGGIPPYSYDWPDGQTTATANDLCAGTYVVTINDDDTSSYEVTVELNDPAPISIAGAVQGVSTGNDGAIDITASGGAGSFTYAWTGPNNFTATTADISNLEAGDYTVVVTDQNDCDTSKTFVVEPTGITSIDGSGFNIFPNPANDHFVLQSTNVIQSVKMSDLLGNELMKQSPLKNNLKVSTANYAQGIYLIEVETVTGTYLKKITIRH